MPLPAVVPTFIVALFLSAGLLFLVEPMVAKMVLPRLGGSPAVWSTCLVFYQAILLLGYAYAHALTRLLPRSGQVIMHVCVVLPAAALLLPLDLGTGAPSAAEGPLFWLLGHLAVRIGLPMFAITATAPLLQSWFSALDHDAAADPYFLYAASNAGSLLALLAYPLLVEPALPLSRQAHLWSFGFGLLAIAIVFCGAALVVRNGSAKAATPARAAPVAWRKRLRWIALAFVPSSLLLGVTAHITTDIAAAPLLWVVPLMLYLLSFILTFARRPPIAHAIVVRLFPVVLVPLVVLAPPVGSLSLQLPLSLLLALHLLSLFTIGMVCHGELAERRPPVAHLTEFYFFVALGGVLGGAFNALAAPLLFPGVWEYPIVLLAACLLLPGGRSRSPRAAMLDVLLPPVLLLIVMFGRGILPSFWPAHSRSPRRCCWSAISFRRWPCCCFCRAGGGSRLAWQRACWPRPRWARRARWRATAVSSASTAWYGSATTRSS